MRIGARLHFFQSKTELGKAGSRAPDPHAVTREQLDRARVLQDLSSNNDVSLRQLQDGRRVVVKVGAEVVDAESALILEAETLKEDVVHRIGLLVGRAFAPKPTILVSPSGARSTLVTPEIDTGRSAHGYQEAFHTLGDTAQARSLLGKYHRDGLSVFDFIVGHGDRHDAWGSRAKGSSARMKNVLVDRDGGLHSIDHEAAFGKPPFAEVSEAAVRDFFKGRDAHRTFRATDLKRLIDDTYLPLVGGDHRELDKLYRFAGIDSHGVERRAREVLKQYEALLADDARRLHPTPPARRRFPGFGRA